MQALRRALGGQLHLTPGAASRRSLLAQTSSIARSSSNKLRSQDRAVHDWHRFVLSFPPHLAQSYLDRFDVSPACTVLDPFCGTGTTLTECKKLGIASVGVNSTRWLILRVP